MELSYNKNKNPTNRVHFIGTSAVLTIDQSHVKRLNIDALTFFEEKAVSNGILLEIRKLETPKETKKND